MKLAELFEAKGFKLYVTHPYGHGFDTVAVTRGEWLTREDGELVAFSKVADGGKTIMGKNKAGQTIEVTLKDIDGKVMQAGDTPTPGKNGFMHAE